MHTFTAVGNSSEEKVNKYKELVTLERGDIYNMQNRLNQRFQKGLVRILYYTTNHAHTKKLAHANIHQNNFSWISRF